MKKKAADPSPEEVSRVFSMMGKKGGPARAEALTAEQRRASAKKAALARWKRKKKD